MAMWTNGQYNVQGPEPPDETFWRGYTKGGEKWRTHLWELEKAKKAAEGKKVRAVWWNNGEVNYKKGTCPGEGYVLGYNKRLPIYSEDLKTGITPPTEFHFTGWDKFKVEIQDWMVSVYGLSGIDLFLAAMIHSQLELSIKDIASMINTDEFSAKILVDRLCRENAERPPVVKKTKYGGIDFYSFAIDDYN